jgi:hypothetical protein
VLSSAAKKEMERLYAEEITKPKKIRLQLLVSIELKVPLNVWSIFREILLSPMFRHSSKFKISLIAFAKRNFPLSRLPTLIWRLIVKRSKLFLLIWMRRSSLASSRSIMGTF